MEEDWGQGRGHDGNSTTGGRKPKLPSAVPEEAVEYEAARSETATTMFSVAITPGTLS